MYILYYFLLTIYTSFVTTNLDTTAETILFIGHAYGHPGLDNKVIDPSVSNFVNNYSTEKYSYIVWGGDFINDCNSTEEVSNFFQSLPESILQKSLFIWGDHEFECYDNENFEFLKHDENRMLTINNYDLFLLNTNFTDTYDYKDILNRINSSPRSKILFTHNVIFSKSNWLLRSNGRDFYDLANVFYDELQGEKELTIIAGDVGAIKGTPYLTYFKKNKNNLLTSGIGNGKNNFAVEIVLNPTNLIFNKLNLDNNVTKELKPNYFLVTLYNIIFYFFLSKKRTVIFFALVAIFLFILKFNKYYIKFFKGFLNIMN
tara:strand:- start:11218 stop:12165 length:948 start_codon:yes stop_codon:yes gene_type:complete